MMLPGKWMRGTVRGGVTTGRESASLVMETDYLLRECVQHRLNRATDGWSICAVSERQLNYKWGSGPKKKECKEKEKTGKRKGTPRNNLTMQRPRFALRERVSK